MTRTYTGRGLPGQAPPPGWVALDGTLQPDLSVAGYRARGQAVIGLCHKGDCRRRCEINLDRLVAAGFGALTITAAQALLRCHNLIGCALDFHDDPRTGLPVRALLGRSHVQVRIKCGGCGFFRVASPEAVIAKLSTGDRAADDLLVSAIVGRITGPCNRCNKTAWRVDVLWPDITSEGWRRGREDP